MPICGNCKAEGTRIRTIWSEDGQKRDECPHCKPEAFSKFTAPSDKKIWMGYEAHPNEYVKASDGGYDRKPEYRAEQEQRLREATEEERIAQHLAEEKKREQRRTKPMDSIELQAALRKAEEIAAWMRDRNVN